MYEHTRRRVLAGLAAAAGLTLVSACASGANGGQSGHSARPATEQNIPSFTYAITQMPTSLNSMSTKVNTQMITSLVTEPMERVAFEQGTVKITPHLAASVTEPDQSTVVYKLREGVKFSDGKPLTAEDVAWSFTASAAPTAETAGNMAGLKSAKVTGPDEVTVTWKYPLVGLRIALAAVQVQEAAFAEAHAKELGTSAALPIGTGPYAYQGQTSQDITLARNPAYWGTRPKPDAVKFTVISDNSAAQLAMRSGSLQAGEVTDLKTASQWKNSGASLYPADDFNSNLLSMDTSTPPFDDVQVRKAVAHAIDVKGVLAAAFGEYAKPLGTLVPTGVLAGVAPSPAEAQAFVDQLPRYEFDLAKAKAELARSAHAGGFDVTVPYMNTDPWQKLLLLNLQQNMKQLGVTVTPKPVPPGQWFQTFFSHQTSGIQVIPGFTSTLPDPSGLMFSFVGKANMKANFINAANFTTDTVEKNYRALAPESAATYDKEARWAATRAVLTEVAEQVPYVPLFTRQNVYTMAGGLTYLRPPSFYDKVSGTWIDLVRSSK
ncbi:ABC transporter substrate-binding protein [Microbispora sp. NPDC046933]|uniref:ABC transporter substrate-binding protein n=1 Tax=Microbispora sp. NPDC046933 TaxID=3155618 RepID=UPI0033C697B1